MQNITKPIITVFFAFIAVAMLLTRTNTVMNNWSNDELNYALRIATQDASAVLMDENQIIGTDEEVNEFHLDLDIQVQNAMEYNLCKFIDIQNRLFPVIC